MNEHDRDAAYTRLCTKMTRLGEPQAPLFLARFALLAIEQIDDPAVVERLIDAAAVDLPAQPAGRSEPGG